MIKRKLSLMLAVVLLAGLLGFYFFLQNMESSASTEPEPTATPAPYYYLIERTSDELVTFSLKRPDAEYNFAKRAKSNDSETKSWYIEEYSEDAISAYNISSLSSSAYSLSTDTKLMDEQPENLEDFGLEEPRAILNAKFSDGTESTVHIGSLAPTGDYYYVTVEGDPALYMLYKYTGDRFFYGIKDLLDISLPKIDIGALTYSYILEEGKPEILLDYEGTDEEKATDISNYGAVVLTMLKPYPGREVYASNFSEYVLKGIDEIFLADLIEYKAEDLSKYGLDNPKLEVWVKDVSNELHIYVGDETGDGYNYCRLEGKDMVFTVKSSIFANLYNIKVFGFIERFVALVNIVDVSEIEIRSENSSFDISLTHTTDEDDYEIIIPVVDGQEVQELAFKTYYSSLIGLAYDTEIPLYTPDKEADVTITYYLNNGQEPIVTRYYSYDNNFYAVQKDDYDIQFVVSKQSMDLMFKNKGLLLTGDLDREY